MSRISQAICICYDDDFSQLKERWEQGYRIVDMKPIGGFDETCKTWDASSKRKIKSCCWCLMEKEIADPKPKTKPLIKTDEIKSSIITELNK